VREAAMSRDSLAAFWRFTKAEIKVAVRRCASSPRECTRSPMNPTQDASRARGPRHIREDAAEVSPPHQIAATRSRPDELAFA